MQFDDLGDPGGVDHLVYNEGEVVLPARLTAIVEEETSGTDAGDLTIADHRGTGVADTWSYPVDGQHTERAVAQSAARVLRQQVHLILFSINDNERVNS